MGGLWRVQDGPTSPPMRPQMRRAGRALLLCRRPVDFPFGPRPVWQWAPMLLCQPSLGYHPPVGRHCANRHVCRPPPTPLHFPLPPLDRRWGGEKKIFPPSPTCGHATVITVGATVTVIAVVGSRQNFFEFLVNVLEVGVLESPQSPPCVATPVQPLDVDCRHPAQVAAALASVQRRRCPLRRSGSLHRHPVVLRLQDEVSAIHGLDEHRPRLESPPPAAEAVPLLLGPAQDPPRRIVCLSVDRSPEYAVCPSGPS